MDFYEICYLSTFRKSVEKIQVSVKPKKMIDALHETLRLAQFFLE